ncbi:MAG: DUF3313 family protein [Akkermansia sp.]|nr:DUF3313 family protein [Akkermansia sp.]
MFKALHLVLLGVGFLLASCSFSQSRLKSESGLYDVQLTHSLKVAVDGYWLPDQPYDAPAVGSIYIAPLDMHLVQEGHEEYVPLMQKQMHDYLTKAISASISTNKLINRWTLTNSPQAATVRLDFSVVHFRTQRSGLRVVSEVGGYFMPVPGVSSVVSSFAEGDICIEGTMRDVKTGRLLMAFKDSNRAKARLYSANAYKRGGAADANLQLWAKKMGELLTIGGEYRAQGKTLKDFINERSYAKGLYQRRTAY